MAFAFRRYLALCPRPTEPLCAAELRTIPEVSDIEELQGAVAFSGPQAALYRANLWLRSATRVLGSLDDFVSPCAEALYERARAIPWEEFLRHGATIAVSAHGTSPALRNSLFTAVKVKDAICDRLRQRSGARPDVDTADPDVRVNVQLYEQAGVWRCALTLDSSGTPLHQRGYREGASEAPLKETLAASILLLAGWQRQTAPVPLVDLCCGGGTLLIEGGLIASDRAPGLMRSFGFERWRGHNERLWRQLRAEAGARALTANGSFLYGVDQDPRVVSLARKALARAGLGANAHVQAGDLRDARPPDGPPGVVVVNPPYGERLGEEQALVPLYRALGDTLKHRFKGYIAWVFTASLPLGRQIGLRPSARHVLYNGNLEGRLLRFDLY